MKDIALHIMDITQNSVRANATEIRITVEERPSENILSVIITDNGSGMSKDVVRRATDPFYTSRTTRKVGMGLPLLKMNAEMSGGSLEIISEPGKGTEVKATFAYDHIDRPPMGDLGGTVALLMSGNPTRDFFFYYAYGDKEWDLSTHDLKDALGDTPVNDLKVVKYLKEMINENIKELRA
jgi:anti-sigma regulatory factor (Ser/Thr protein kinase)